MPSCGHGLMNQKEDKDNKRSVLLASHTHIMLIFVIFSAIGRPKCSMMPRWHHSVSLSERCQEVKIIKTFYAAHISRSQAKFVFGNWTIYYVLCDSKGKFFYIWIKTLN